MSVPTLLSEQYQLGDDGVLLNGDADDLINYALNPAQVSGGSIDECISRFSWTRTYVTTSSPSGATTAVRFASGETSTGTGRGADWYGDLDLVTPGATGAWLDQPVTPGETITVGADCIYALSNKSPVSAYATIRFHDGAGNWVGTAQRGSLVSAAFNSWVTVRNSVVVPAGAKYAVASIRELDSVTFTTNDYFVQTALVFGRRGFFDVTSVQGFDNPPVRSTVTPREGLNGSWVDAQYTNERTIVLEGNVYGDPFGVDRYLRKLRNNYKPSKDLLPLYFGTQEGVRMVQGRSLGFNYTKDSSKGMGIVAGQMQIVCPDPRIYDPTPITVNGDVQDQATQTNSSWTVVDAGTSTTDWSSTLQGEDTSGNPTTATIDLTGASSHVKITLANPGPPSGDVEGLTMDAILTMGQGSGHDKTIDVDHYPYIVLAYTTTTVSVYPTFNYYLNDVQVYPIAHTVTRSGSGTYTYTVYAVFTFYEDVTKLRLVYGTGELETATITIKYVGKSSNFIVGSQTTSVKYVQTDNFVVGGDTDTDYTISLLNNSTADVKELAITLYDAATNYPVGVFAFVSDNVQPYYSESGFVLKANGYKLNIDTDSRIVYITDPVGNISTSYPVQSYTMWDKLAPGTYYARFSQGTTAVGAEDFVITTYSAWE